MPEPSPSSARRKPLRPELEQALALGLATVAAFVALTCGSRGHIERGAATPSAAPTRAASASASANAKQAPAPREAASASSANSAVAVARPEPAHTPKVVDPTELDLPHFYADLAGLEQHTRRTPVRVLWLGDSHTAADYLTGALRARLQARFGAGGPGFVRIGVKPYRHTQVRWACDGPWRVEPPQPSRRAPFDDGVFGLGGMRALPGDAPSFAAFELSKGTAHGQLGWEVWFSLPDSASFRVDLAGVSQIVTRSTQVDSFPGSGLTRLTLTSSLADKLQITTLVGSPRFFGLTVEGTEPGVVLDTVGIDGARVATALAWGAQSFETAVRARMPALVALAFGTNEAFDADKVEKYRAQYHDVLSRLRQASPGSDCVIVGPPDANALAGGSEPRVTEIDLLQRSVAGELGCGYVSQLALMGGAGSYTRWASKLPPLARGDRLHLTPKGYEQIAAAIGDQLLAAYGRSVQASPGK